jgi:hypothetical protein
MGIEEWPVDWSGGFLFFFSFPFHFIYSFEKFEGAFELSVKKANYFLIVVKKSKLGGGGNPDCCTPVLCTNFGVGKQTLELD